ncbi:MAG: hypothetical protein JO322_15595, partial [Candidatus Eremiobacteraeota bacterium]|nr:hypothetical protein [Candidatus Eremiobacteraeota bacterium]
IALSSNDDTPSTAAALYVYYAASLVNSPNGDKTFDWFNFNQIIAFAQHLRQTSSLDATETKFLTDITNAQTNGQTLFPVGASWSNVISADGTNGAISADIQAVAKDTNDSTLPTPCPGIGQCSGAPTP